MIMEQKKSIKKLAKKILLAIICMAAWYEIGSAENIDHKKLYDGTANPAIINGRLSIQSYQKKYERE